jgi:hypothetical protein
VPPVPAPDEMFMEHLGNDNWQGKNEVFGEKPNLVPPLCPSQISYKLTPGLNWGLYDQKTVTNHLSYESFPAINFNNFCNPVKINLC